jgi:hypothetical protein
MMSKYTWVLVFVEQFYDINVANLFWKMERRLVVDLHDEFDLCSGSQRDVDSRSIESTVYGFRDQTGNSLLVISVNSERHPAISRLSPSITKAAVQDEAEATKQLE